MKRDSQLFEIIEKEKPFEVMVHAGDMEDQVSGILGYTDYQIRIVAGNCEGRPGRHADGQGSREALFPVVRPVWNDGRGEIA